MVAASQTPDLADSAGTVDDLLAFDPHQLIRVCCRCCTVVGVVPALEGGVTHTICDACDAVLEAEAVRADRRTGTR